MRGFFDWMTGNVEPYVSFRFLLVLVFIGMFVHWCIVSVLTVRDFLQQVPASSARERQAGRIARNAALLILLRSFSLEMLRRNAWLLLQVVVLLVLSVVLSVQVFSRQ